MNIKRKILSAVCAAVMLLNLAPAAFAAGFSDVKSSDWFHDAVAWAVENGITSGTTATTFSPNQTCNNAEILTFLWRAAGEPSVSGANPFSNISSNDYYYKPALWAEDKGMVSGGSFDAGAKCTRAMAVTYIWKAQDMPFSMAPASFSDVPAEKMELSAPVAWAVENGVTSGTGNHTFSPDKTCTRAEIVTFLQRAYGGGAQTSQTAELLRLINAERKNAGLKELQTSSALAQAAQMRSGDLSKGYFETRPDGSEWASVLYTVGVDAEYVDESVIGGSPEASAMFQEAKNTAGAYEAMLSPEYTHAAVGYTYAEDGYGGYHDFWSVLYIIAPAQSSTPTTPVKPSTPATPGTPAAADFTPVAMKDLANLKSLQKKATDDQLAQAYDIALEIVKPLAGLSREEQLVGIKDALRAMFDSGMEYSTSAEHYNDPYGYFVLGVASCAGCTRATGLCLNILGIPYEHVNENQWGHQWCRVNVDGTYWICDAYGLYAGPEPAPYTHPYL